MIYNTGELLGHPFESMYSRVRRFYTSNRGLKIEWRQICRALADNHAKDQEKIRNINSPYVHWPLVYLAKNSLVTTHDLDNLSFKKLKGYYPKKHCPVCAEIYFHSNVFDMPWVKTCPIHNVELSRYCPKCDMNWPTAAKLRHLNCSTCGTNAASREIFDAAFLSRKSELLKLHGHNRLQKEIIPKTIPSVIIRGHRYYEQINLKSQFLISVLKKLESLPENLVSYFNEATPSSGVAQLDFINGQSDWDFGRRGIPSSETVREVKTALTDVLIENHKLGACRSENSDCVACKTWYLWCISVSNTSVFKYEHDLSIWENFFKRTFHFDCPAIVKKPRQIIISNDTSTDSAEKRCLLNNSICKKVFDLRAIDALVYIYNWLLECQQLTSYFQQSDGDRMRQPERCYRYGNKRYPKIPIFLCHLDSNYTLAWPIFSMTQYLQNSEELLFKWYGKERNV